MMRFLIFAGVFFAAFAAYSQDGKKYMELSDFEKNIIERKGTEIPFSGKYDNFYEDGAYVCKKCGNALFVSGAKFDAGCGWPAFDDQIPFAVRRSPDPDGRRTEISCANCGGHLGHVFEGEKFTKKNTRHCVNSASLDFIPRKFVGRAIVAGGCFWCVENSTRHAKGVICAMSGYCGGRTQKPTYKQVCSGLTGHYEAVEIFFDTRKTSYEKILERFFEIHDFEQTDGQGPDIGEQYKSAIFVLDPQQKIIAEKLLGKLRKKGFTPATKIVENGVFYPAEEIHQRYYERHNISPSYNHGKKIF